MIHKAHALDQVYARATTYANWKDQGPELRRSLAEAMATAHIEAGATQQEIANVTADHEADRLSRQRVKQLIDEVRE